MKKLLLPLLLLVGLAGCRTTEANYRAAYEKAKAHRDSWNGIDGTVYDAVRRESRQSVIKIDGREIPVLTVVVKPVDGQGIDTLSRRYVAVGQFKQLFNARSLCKRFRDAGYESACMLVTAEPLYYVAIPAPDSDVRLAAEFDRLQSAPPVALSEPYPQVLIPAK